MKMHTLVRINKVIYITKCTCPMGGFIWMSKSNGDRVAYNNINGSVFADDHISEQLRKVN